MEVEGLVLVEGGLVGKEKGSVNWYSIFLILCFVVLFKEMSCSIVLDSKTTFQEKISKTNQLLPYPIGPPVGLDTHFPSEQVDSCCSTGGAPHRSLTPCPRHSRASDGTHRTYTLGHCQGVSCDTCGDGSPSLSRRKL